MPSVEIVDETVIGVRRETLAAPVADHARWVAWGSGLDATIAVDRGLDSCRWTMTGSLVGTEDVALTPVVADSRHGRRELAELHRRHAFAWKATVWSLEDELESGV